MKERNLKPDKADVISIVGFLIFLIISLFNIFERFWVGIIFLLIAILFHPEIHLRITKRLNFEFNRNGKFLLFLILFIALGISKYQYDKKDAEIERQRLEAEFRIQKEKEILRIEKKRIEKLRVDSLNYYYTLSFQHSQRSQYSSAIKYLNKSLEYSIEEKATILEKRTELYYKSKEYSKALDDYTRYINSRINLSDNLYNRSLCYLKLNKTQEAANDLKEAINYNNQKAKELYEKINPLISEVFYYVTRCCDGTTSSARGRGACSHHNGVCNWYDPVYITYRKY